MKGLGWPRHTRATTRVAPTRNPFVVPTENAAGLPAEALAEAGGLFGRPVKAAWVAQSVASELARQAQ